MTNSFFNFTEAPDFASAIAGTYSSVNESYDRREQLERENDKTRERNAEMPLEVIKALIEFSPKAKQIADGLQAQAEKRALRKGYEGIGQEELDNSNNALNDVMNIGKYENFIKQKALEDGDNITYNTIDYGGPHGARRKWLDLNDLKSRVKTGFNAFITKNYPTAFENPQERAVAFSKYKEAIIGNADEAGFNTRFLKNGLEDTFNELQTTFNQTENQKLTARNAQKEQSRMIQEVVTALNSDTPLQSFIEASDYNIGFFDGNIAKAERAFINIGLMGMKKGVINIDKFESVLFGEITAKGDKTRILIDKLGGGEENTLWAEGVLASIEEAKKGVFENKALARQNYAKGFVEKIQEIENGQETRMTKLELANYVSQNWDIKQGGSNLPEFVKNRFSKEAGDDILIKAQLDYKLDKGIPITEEEVLKLSDPFVEASYLSKVKTGNPLAPSKDFQSLAMSQIKGYATTHAKQQGVAPGKESTQWNNIVENAEREYPLLFAKYMQTADSAVDAHILALGDIEKKTNAGVYDNLVANRSKNKQRSIDLIKAEEHIKTIDPNIINTGLIFGSEEVIKEASLLPSGQTHLFYDQLAAKIPGVTGAEIQYKQLEIYNKANGLEKPVKSDVLLAYEKLDPQVQFYLSHHPSPAKVARAKIEAFKDDAQIDYDEISFLVPEAQEVIKTLIKEDAAGFARNLSSEEFLNLPEDMQEGILGTTPQLGKLEPRKGDWQKTDRGTFIVFDGSQWVERGVFATGKKQPFQGEIDEYLDRDKVRRKI